jgi:hypothetical protein
MQRPGPDHDIAAIRALARDLGLGPVDPIVLKLAHHTTLRLAPLAIVARVQSSEPVARATTAMGREVTLARYLAAQSAPAVAPSVDPPPGPYVIGNCVVTLWSYVDHRPARNDEDFVAAADALRALHRAMLGYPGELPPFTEGVDRCGVILGDLAAMPALSPEDRAFLEGRYSSLREDLSAASFACAPLHGDTHPGNILFSSEGPIWADLESACLGPLEWDLVQLAPSARALFGVVDPSLIERFDELRSVTVAVWCWADANRSPEVRAAAEHHLARLRRRV